MKPVYIAASEAAALDQFAEFSGKWEKRYPAIIRLWENAWAEFVPFLQFDLEIRTVICTTNAIESINARLRRAVNARGHFPTEQAAMKCLYLAIMSLDPTWEGPPAVDQPVESTPQRVRHHLRRPPQRRPELTTKISYTVKLTVPPYRSKQSRAAPPTALSGWYSTALDPGTVRYPPAPRRGPVAARKESNRMHQRNTGRGPSLPSAARRMMMMSPQSPDLPGNRTYVS